MSRSKNNIKTWDKCVKSIRHSKYERLSKANADSWNKTFKDLEDYSKIPFWSRLSELQNIFSYKQILEFINAGIIREFGEDTASILLRLSSHKPGVDNKLSLYRKRKKYSFVAKSPKIYCAPPYCSFFKKSIKEARVWVEKRKSTLNEVPLIQKAALWEDDITTAFVEKFKKDDPKELAAYKQMVHSLFSIICPFPLREAIKVNSNILGSVNETTAKYLNRYKYSSQACLRKQIKNDLKTSEMEPVTVAFLKSLPCELIRKANVHNLRETWFEINSTHKEIESFAAVWKDITELETTRLFCMWLLDHPDIKPPGFLKNKGMLTRNVLKRPVFLGDTETDFEGMAVEYGEGPLIHASKQSLDETSKHSEDTDLDRSTSVGDISEVNFIL